MSKYGHRNINWFEEIVNKLGGEEAGDRFLRDELTVSETVRQSVEQPIETVTVPDLPAAALLAVVKEKAGLTYLDSDCQRYAFIRDERGKKFEVARWAPGRGISSNAVREHFRALGFEGNPAAFVAWIANVHRDGWYVSVPEDDKRFVVGGGLYAPYFNRDGSRRELSLGWLGGAWYGGYVFVAFREIPQ